MKTRMNIYLSSNALHIIHQVQEEHGVSISAAIGIIVEAYKKTHSQEALVEKIAQRVLKEISEKGA